MPLMRPGLLALLLSLSLPQLLFSRGADTLKCFGPDLNFQSLRAELSNSNVRQIVQDSFGYLWMGTQEGLNRYDGTQVRVFGKERDNPHSLSDEQINDLLIDSRHHLWVATYQNLLRYQYDKEQFEVVPNPLPNLPLDALALEEDAERKLWIGTLHGLYQYDSATRSIHRPAHTPNLDERQINTLLEDHQQRLWIGTDRGLLCLAADRTELLQFNLDATGLSQTTINTLLEDEHGTLWIGTESQGLFRLVESQALEFQIRQFLPVQRQPYSLQDTKVRSLLQDSQGRIWVGTEQAGLHLFCPEREAFFRYSMEPQEMGSLPSNSIWTIFEDQAQRLWLGFDNQGAALYDPYFMKFQHVTKGLGNSLRLKNNTVTSFLEVNDNIWIGTDGGGISEWNPKTQTYRFFNHDSQQSEGLGSDKVLCLFRDSEGIIWTGNWEGGLNQFKPEDGSFTNFKHEPDNPNSIGSNNIFAIDEDQDGNLWMSSWGHGLTRYNKSEQSFFHIPFVQYHPYYISSPHTYDVEIDDTNGDIWLGTVLGVEVITIIDEEEYCIRHLQPQPDEPHTLSAARVQCIMEDRNHRMWVGTNDGLNLYHRADDTFEHFFVADGLPGNSIRAIVEDQTGNLWVSTNNGLAKLFRQNEEWVFRKFERSDGIQDRKFTARAGYLRPNGELFFGGVNGFNHFFPAATQDNPYPPKTQLTGLRIFDKEVPIDGAESLLDQSMLLTHEIVLSHRQLAFSIEYLGVNYTQPEKNRYAYQLQGFEEEWNYVGNQRTATYTNLDPGRYTFLVKSANHNGAWEQTARSLSVVVLPAWWQTWWAQTLFYLGIVGIPLSILWVRYSTIQEQNQVLEQRVEARTAQITQQKEALVQQAKTLQTLNQQKNKLFSIISHDLRSPLASLQGITQFLDPSILERKDLEHIRHEMTQRVRGLSEVVDDLLFWAKGQLDGATTQAERFDMYTLGTEMLRLYGDQAAQKGVYLLNKMLENTWVYADKNQVRVILRNLIGNGLKFTEVGASVCIDLVETDANHATFKVEDTGVGMDPERVDQLFSGREGPLSSGTSGEQGFGLGLILVKEFVEKNGGHIWVDSEVGRGTRFFFRLPHRRPPVVQ